MSNSKKIAIEGGSVVRTKPFVNPDFQKRRFDEGEKEALLRVIDSGNLCRTFAGREGEVEKFEREFAVYYGMGFAVASTSGTAAIHVALGAIGVGPGDEVITPPMTDMGSIIPILLQNAIPIFTDIDPRTFNLDPEDVERKITDRTKAIIAVHLAGNPCDMDSIMDIAERYGLKLIEDVAQSFSAGYHGRMVGTMGDMGCFSLNQYKHITCGDGGMTVTNDTELARRAKLFADKGYVRDGLGEMCEFLCMNYRMTELQAAVGRVQLGKLGEIVAARRRLGNLLSDSIRDVDGLIPPYVAENTRHSYYTYLLMIDEEILGVSAEKFAEAVSAEGVPASLGLRNVMSYPVLRERKTYGDTSCPFDCPRYRKNVDYKEYRLPNAERITQKTVSIPIKECLTEADIGDVAKALKKVSDYYETRK
ncbi:MAG: DegT/DnrJ/EryC1/StrS family aminotransferase [Candidatus Bathyarchaeota archaeon]|nr:DegT/DnrJ/EryC1/StrS family aminotransferase [Candidatus Bathyarchaeota archaeon]